MPTIITFINTIYDNADDDDDNHYSGGTGHSCWEFCLEWPPC